MDLLFVFSVVVLVLLSGCLFRYFVSGVGILYGHSALQDSTPFWHHVCCPLFLCFSFVWCVRRRRFSLFFSLSPAGETQTPSGLGFPL